MNNKKDIISIETSSNVCGISFISNCKCIKTIEEGSDRKHVEKIPLFFQEIQKIYFIRHDHNTLDCHNIYIRLP